MAGFNITAQLQLQSPTNLDRVVGQIKNSVKNITADIDVRINPTSGANLKGLNQQIGILNSSLKELKTNADIASNSLSGLSRGFGNFGTSSNNSVRSLQATLEATKKLAQGTKEATDATEEFGRTAGLAGRRFLGFSLVAGSIVGTMAAIKNGISESLKFEREFIKISQLGSITKNDLNALNSEITRLSTNLGVSSKDLIATSVTLRAAGLSVKEVTSAMEVLAKTTLAPSFGKIADNTEGAIAIMAQFRTEAKDLETSISSINAVANAFAVESKDIITAVQRSGGAFRSAGGDLNEFSALFTSVRATTRESAESIATGLRTVFTRLQRRDTIEALKELGINLRATREEALALGRSDLENQFVGGYEAVRRLSEGLKGLRTTDPRFSEVIEQLGGYRQISKVIPLIQEFATSQKALNIAQAGFTSLTSASEEAQTTFIVKLQKVKEEFLALARTIVGSNAFKGFLDTTLSIANGFIKITEAVSPLIPLLTALAAVKFVSGFASFFGGVKQGLNGISPTRISQKPVTLASGGVVPGHGSGDTVPAMLTPGEFVVNQGAAKNIGYGKLHQMNKFAGGGTVKFKVGNYDLSENNTKFLYQLANAKDGGASLLEKNQDVLKGLFGQSGNKSGNYESAKDVFNKLGFPGQNLTEFRKTLEANKTFVQTRNAAVSSGNYINNGNLIIPFKGETIGYVASGTPGGEAGKQGRDTLNAGLRQETLNLSNLGEKTNKTAKTLLQNAGVKSITGGVNVHVLGNRPTEEFNTEVINDVEKNIQDIYLKKFGSGRVAPLSRAQTNTIAGYLFEKYVEGLSGKFTAGNESGFEYTKTKPGSTLGKAFDSFVFPSPVQETYLDLKSRFQRDHTGDIMKKYLNAKSNDGSLASLLGIRGTAQDTSALGLAGKGASSANLRLATGGVVPGHGNGDTVPAVLTPGEFVIKKSSAQAIGYDKLHSINKYAKGGPVISMGINGSYGGLFLDNGGASNKSSTRGLQTISREDSAAVFDATKSRKVRDDIRTVLGLSGNKDLFLEASGTSGFRVYNRINNRTSASEIKIGVTGDVPSYLLNPTKSEKFSKDVDGSIQNLGIEASKSLLNGLPNRDLAVSQAGDIIKSIGNRGILGYAFESALLSLNSNSSKVASRGQGADFDIVGGTQKIKESGLFGIGNPKESNVDVKAGFTSNAKLDIIKKAISFAADGKKGFSISYNKTSEAPDLIRDIYKEIGYSSGFEAPLAAKPVAKKASGGNTTDTVPAMLTPGEFIISKGAASKIGTADLHYMNQTGKVRGYASGGPVDVDSVLSREELRKIIKQKEIEDNRARIATGRNFNLTPEGKVAALTQSQLDNARQVAEEARNSSRPQYSVTPPVSSGPVPTVLRTGNVGSIVAQYKELEKELEKLNNSKVPLPLKEQIFDRLVKSLDSTKKLFNEVKVAADNASVSIDKTTRVSVKVDKEGNKTVASVGFPYQDRNTVTEARRRLDKITEQEKFLKDNPQLRSIASDAGNFKEPGFFSRTGTAIKDRFNRFIGPQEEGGKGALGRFGDRLSGPGLIALSLSAGYGAQAFENKQADFDLAATNNSKAESVTSRAGKGGALTGAAAGAAFGSAFGPLGTAIGGLAGGIIGYTDGVKEAEKEIKSAKIGKAVTELAETIQKTLKNEAPLDGAIRASLKNNIKTIQTETSGKAALESTNSIFASLNPFSNDKRGLDVTKYSDSKDRELRQSLGKELPEIFALLSRESRTMGENFAKTNIDLEGLPFENVKARLDELDKNFIDLNRDLLEPIAQLKKVSVEEVAKDFRRSRVEGFTDVKRKESDIKTDVGVGQQLNSISRLAVAAESVAVSMARLQVNSLQLSDIFDGIVGSAGLITDNKLGVLSGGSSREAFGQSVEGLRGIAGNDIVEFAKVFDNIKANLASVLTNVLGDAKLDEKDASIRVRQGLTQSLTGGTRALDSRENTVLSSVSKNIGNIPFSELSIDARKDIHKLTEKLLTEVNPIENLGKILETVAQNATSYTNELGKQSGRLKTIGIEEDKFRGIQLAKLRNFIDQTGKQNYTSGSIYNNVPLSVLNRPITERAKSLTGLGNQSENPDAIANKLKKVQDDILEASKQTQGAFDADKFKSQASRDAADKLVKLKLEASNLQTALKDLTDTTVRNAAAQEKLNAIQQDKSSRLSFGERFATSGPQEKAEINRGLRLVYQGAGQGNNVSNFSSENLKKYFETLSSLGNAKLTGLGGRRASDIKEEALAKLYGGVFDNDKGDKNNEKILIQEISANFARAEAAQQALIQNQKTIYEKLTDDLRKLQNDFFAKLDKNIKEEKIKSEEQKLSDTKTQLGDLGRNRGEAKEFLAKQIAVRHDSEVNFLKNNKDIVEIRNLEKQIKDLGPASAQAKSSVGGFETGAFYDTENGQRISQDKVDIEHYKARIAEFLKNKNLGLNDNELSERTNKLAYSTTSDTPLESKTGQRNIRFRGDVEKLISDEIKDIALSRGEKLSSTKLNLERNVLGENKISKYTLDRVKGLDEQGFAKLTANLNKFDGDKPLSKFANEVEVFEKKIVESANKISDLKFSLSANSIISSIVPFIAPGSRPTPGFGSPSLPTGVQTPAPSFNPSFTPTVTPGSTPGFGSPSLPTGVQAPVDAYTAGLNALFPNEVIPGLGITNPNLRYFPPTASGRPRPRGPSTTRGNFPGTPGFGTTPGQLPSESNGFLPQTFNTPDVGGLAPNESLPGLFNLQPDGTILQPDPLFNPNLSTSNNGFFNRTFDEIRDNNAQPFNHQSSLRPEVGISLPGTPRTLDEIRRSAASYDPNFTPAPDFSNTPGSPAFIGPQPFTGPQPSSFSPPSSTVSSGTGVFTGLLDKAFNIFGTNVNSMQSILGIFSSSVNVLEKAMEAFPDSVKGEFTHNVNLNVSGTEAFASMSPEIEKLILAKAKDVLSNYIKNNIPEAGIPT